jgi:hypothetical protein
MSSFIKKPRKAGSPLFSMPEKQVSTPGARKREGRRKHETVLFYEI